MYSVCMGVYMYVCVQLLVCTVYICLCMCVCIYCMYVCMWILETESNDGDAFKPVYALSHGTATTTTTRPSYSHMVKLNLLIFITNHTAQRFLIITKKITGFDSKPVVEYQSSIKVRSWQQVEQSENASKKGESHDVVDIWNLWNGNFPRQKTHFIQLNEWMVNWQYL